MNSAAPPDQADSALSALSASSAPPVAAASTDPLPTLLGWIARHTTPAALDWLQQQINQIRQSDNDNTLFKALGMAARKLGKADLALSAQDLAQACLLRPGFDPSGWSVDLAARVALILASFNGNAAQFAARLDRLADSGEINELIALYSGFALYPLGPEIEPRAREAIRSSMRPIFDAMALCNPYPMQQFDQAAWNQMIVKTFFLDSPLWPVQGVVQRANPDLSRILIDLAHERWAAARPISPELWRCVALHPGPDGLAALQRVLDTGSEPEQLAVALALQASHDPACAPLQAQCAANGLSARASKQGWPQLMQHWAGWAD
jgi:hypothetical protein